MCRCVVVAKESEGRCRTSGLERTDGGKWSPSSRGSVFGVAPLGHRLWFLLDYVSPCAVVVKQLVVVVALIVLQELIHNVFAGQNDGRQRADWTAWSHYIFGSVFPRKILADLPESGPDVKKVHAESVGKLPPYHRYQRK